MKKLLHWCGLAILVSAWAGCGGSSSTTTANSGSGHAPDPSAAAQEAPSAVPLPVNAESQPHEVVLAFLNGMRDGNSGVTGALLTRQAHEETLKHNWPVQPPGAPSATYQLGDASFLDPQQSAVQIPCVWSEPDAAGGNVQFQVVWVLRKQQDGWRVAGFATEIVPGKPPYYFNFEDIAQLKATQQEAENALAEMMQTGENSNVVAEGPPTTGSLR
jgi:hypothetical protein